VFFHEYVPNYVKVFVPKEKFNSFASMASDTFMKNWKNIYLGKMKEMFQTN